MSEEPVTIDDVMAAVAKDISTTGVAKGSVNKEQNFRYRSIDDVLNVVGPIMARHGLAMTMAVAERDVSESRATKSGGTLKFVTLRCSFRFGWKGQERTTTTIGEAMDSGDKATNKAMAIAMKYALVSTFAIPFVGADDPDAYSVTEDIDPARTVAAVLPGGGMGQAEKEKAIQEVLEYINSQTTFDDIKKAFAKGAELAHRLSDKSLHEKFKKTAADRWTHLKSQASEKQDFVQ